MWAPNAHIYNGGPSGLRKEAQKIWEKTWTLGPTTSVKCEALQAWDESGSGRLTVAGVASICRLSLWQQSSDATKRTNQSSPKGRWMVLVWSKESSDTLLVQESSYVPLQRFRWKQPLWYKHCLLQESEESISVFRNKNKLAVNTNETCWWNVCSI